MGGGLGENTPVVRRPVDGAHPYVMEALHFAELTQMKEEGELPSHGPECQEGGRDLGQEEEQVEGVDGSLQRQDDGPFIGQEEQQNWQLEHEGQDPEGCQLRHLVTGGGDEPHTWCSGLRQDVVSYLLLQVANEAQIEPGCFDHSEEDRPCYQQSLIVSWQVTELKPKQKLAHHLLHLLLLHQPPDGAKVCCWVI